MGHILCNGWSYCKRSTHVNVYDTPSAFFSLIKINIGEQQQTDYDWAMSNVGEKRSKRRSIAASKRLGWVVPTKRQPLFPSPPTAQTAAPAPASSAKPHSLASNHNAAATPQNQGYFASAKRPIVSLYFLMPLILCYEIAKIFAGGELLSSGIDLWIHNFLCIFGAGQLVILPLLTTAVMLYYHHKINDHWYAQPSTFAKMAAEAIGFGFMLFFFAHIFQIVAVASPSAGKVVDPYYWQIGSATWWANVVTYVGTGIHEELIFRVILMLPAIAFLKSIFSDQQAATMLAVVVIGFLFALAHVDLINPLGQPFDPTSFSFRFVASCLFAVVFLYRGFGIAVGTHIIYNVLTLLG